MKTRWLPLVLVLATAAPASADDRFHLFPEAAEPAPDPFRLQLHGLPPAAPLAALSRGPQSSGSPGSAAQKTLPPYPTEKRWDLATAEWAALELLPWAFNRYVSNGEFAYISLNTVKQNYQTGFAYDHDAFKTNQSSHPFHGSLFFNTARTNGFSFWESAPFALLGSLVWELHLENEPPAINDLVNTTLGGMTRGEAMYRLSNLLVDNTKSGSERFWREAGGLVLNPIGGFNRLIKGEMWHDFQNPPDRFPSRFYLEVDGFYRGRSGSATGDVDKNQGGLSLVLRYGDPFEGEHEKPFEYFDIAADLAQPAATFVTRIQTRGLLTQWELGDGDSAAQRLGLFLHFDYLNNSPAVYGAQVVSADHLMRVPLGSETDLRTDLAAGVMPMAGVQVDHDMPGASPEYRSYDFGPGAGAQALVELRRRDMDLLTLSYNVFWQHTSNGVSRNNRIQTLTAEGRLPIWKSFALGAGWTWGGRLSTYDQYPTVDATGTSWRAFAAWSMREVTGATAAAAPSAASAGPGDSKGRWEVSGFGGGFFGSRVYTSDTLNVMTSTAPAFGGRVAYGLTRVLSLEASWTHADTSLEPEDPKTNALIGPTTPLTMNAYELDALFGFGGRSLRGFVGFGGGAMTLSPNVPSLDRTGGTSKFAANLALGGKYFLSDNVALRVDFHYRWRAGDDRLAVTVCNSSGCNPFNTSIYSSLDLAGGLTYRF